MNECVSERIAASIVTFCSVPVAFVQESGSLQFERVTGWYTRT